MPFHLLYSSNDWLTEWLKFSSLRVVFFQTCHTFPASVSYRINEPIDHFLVRKQWIVYKLKHQQICGPQLKKMSLKLTAESLQWWHDDETTTSLADCSRQELLQPERNANRRLVWQALRKAALTDRRALRPGRSATATRGPRYRGALSWNTLNVSTAIFFTAHFLRSAAV